MVTSALVICSRSRKWSQRTVANPSRSWSRRLCARAYTVLRMVSVGSTPRLSPSVWATSTSDAVSWMSTLRSRMSSVGSPRRTLDTRTRDFPQLLAPSGISTPPVGAVTVRAEQQRDVIVPLRLVDDERNRDVGVERVARLTCPEGEAIATGADLGEGGHPAVGVGHRLGNRVPAVLRPHRESHHHPDGGDALAQIDDACAHRAHPAACQVIRRSLLIVIFRCSAAALAASSSRLLVSLFSAMASISSAVFPEAKTM